MDKETKTIWSVGATSRISIEMQRIWATKGYKFILLSRNINDLKNIKKDLIVHGAESVEISNLGENAMDKFMEFKEHRMDILLISIGSLSEQKRWQEDNKYRLNEWSTNTSLVMDWIEIAAGCIENGSKTHLCVMTSVAADRAKRSNYAYGCAKAALDFYLKGIEHRLSSFGKTISILKPGPTKSPMTSTMTNKKLADPKEVALVFTEGIDKKKGTIYAPKIWEYIMLTIKGIPKFIWDKTNF